MATTTTKKATGTKKAKASGDKPVDLDVNASGAAVAAALRGEDAKPAGKAKGSRSAPPKEKAAKPAKEPKPKAERKPKEPAVLTVEKAPKEQPDLAVRPAAGAEEVCHAKGKPRYVDFKRATGTRLAIFNAEQSGGRYDPAKGAWAAECVEHGYARRGPNMMAVARGTLEWCPGCAEIIAGKAPKLVQADEQGATAKAKGATETSRKPASGTTEAPAKKEGTSSVPAVRARKAPATMRKPGAKAKRASADD